ncbi:hypothetical protein KAR91_41305 [Candidatus Pacearchaeota archaeon]|nr:hypothetical protein [Candidatus Pacearchaeota archaeon]
MADNHPQDIAIAPTRRIIGYTELEPPDPAWVDLRLNKDGSVPVILQDQTTPALDLYFIQQEGSVTALTNDVEIDDRLFDLDSVADVNVGTYLGIFSGISGQRRFYFGEVLSVGSINPTTVEMDTPIDFEFMVGDPVIASTRELNVVGSTTSPEVFQVQAGGVGNEFSIDITRIMIEITCSNAPNFPSFGDISLVTDKGLIAGVVLRQVNGITRNIWNVKANSEFANLAYDYTPLLATNPGLGVNGIICRYTFAGQAKHGVALRLEAGDSLQLIIQDDLSSLLSFRIIAQGHVKE